MPEVHSQNKSDMLDNSILTARGIYKKYKNASSYANEDVSLSVQKGQIMGLLGPNGAGKTTFVRQACGLLRPDAGQIFINGVDIAVQNKYTPNVVSYLGQIAYTHRALKVMEFIKFTGVYRGLDSKEAVSQARTLLEYFDMLSLENKLLDYLSGGEVRIVAFIAAIVGYKPLIILDEPTNDVDPEKRILLWKLVKKLSIDKRTSFLLVTHNIHEAQDVVDAVTIMQNGRVVKCGVPSELADSLDIDTKIDFTIPYDFEIPEEIMQKWHTKKLNKECVRISAKREDIQNALSDLYSSAIGPKIRDIKIIPPSLEDIYLSNIQEDD